MHDFESHLGFLQLLASPLDDAHGKVMDDVAVLLVLPVVRREEIDQVKVLVEGTAKRGKSLNSLPPSLPPSLTGFV